jgi:predicted nucleic-acid-binding protein
LKAIDANILLRLVVADDPKQEALAHRLLAAEQLLVPLTVILECEWVLRSYYKKSAHEIAVALDQLTDLEGLVFDQVRGVRWALQRLAKGADFADMIHILASAAVAASSFVTFDEGIESEAGPDVPIRVETLV